MRSGKIKGARSGEKDRVNKRYILQTGVRTPFFLPSPPWVAAKGSNREKPTVRGPTINLNTRPSRSKLGMGNGRQKHKKRRDHKMNQNDCHLYTTTAHRIQEGSMRHYCQGALQRNREKERNHLDAQGKVSYLLQRTLNTTNNTGAAILTPPQHPTRRNMPLGHIIITGA